MEDGLRRPIDIGHRTPRKDVVEHNPSCADKVEQSKATQNGDEILNKITVFIMNML
jgi:hypothetical protein